MTRQLDLFEPVTSGPALLVMMACSATKLEGRKRALELYNGPLWQTLRVHQGAAVSCVVVLSAKYGFINALSPIEPYDERMSRAKADYLIRQGVINNNTRFGAIKPGRMPGCNPLVEADGTLRCSPCSPAPYTSVIIAASGDYLRAHQAMLAGFQARGLVTATAAVHVTQGGIGEQRAQLGRWLVHYNHELVRLAHTCAAAVQAPHGTPQHSA